MHSLSWQMYVNKNIKQHWSIFSVTSLNKPSCSKGCSSRQIWCVLIRLSPRPTTGSMLSICANWRQPWLSTCLSEAICHFRARFRSSSDCFRTKRPARPTLSAPDGAVDSSVTTARHPESRTALPIAPAFSGVAIATAMRASPLARSWNDRTHRSRFGSGQPTWSPAKRPACRPSSSSGNSDCRVTRLLSRFFTNCEPAWCVPTKIGSVATQENTSRPTKPMSAVVLATRAEAFTTWFSSPAQSRLSSDGTTAVSTSGGLDGMPDVFDLRWCQTEVPNRWVDSSSASLRQALPLLPTIGAVTRRSKGKGIFIPPWRNVATCKLPRPSCLSFTSCSPISKHGYVAFTTASARNTCKPISTNSRSASTAVSILSTPSAPCWVLLAASPHRPTPNFMLKNHDPLQVVGLGANRISTVQTMRELTGSPLTRRVLLGLFLALLAATVVLVLAPFIVPMLWAAIIAFASWPLYIRLLGG